MATREDLMRAVLDLPDPQVPLARIVLDLEDALDLDDEADLEVIIAEGKEATARAREAFADVPQEEIEREAVRGVKEGRRRRGAERRAAAARKTA
jgi:hypothetical protein